MKNWDIGREAKELNEKPIYERMKLEKASIKKIVGALIIYFIMMYIFYLFL